MTVNPNNQICIVSEILDAELIPEFNSASVLQIEGEGLSVALGTDKNTMVQAFFNPELSSRINNNANVGDRVLVQGFLESTLVVGNDGYEHLINYLKVNSFSMITYKETLQTKQKNNMKDRLLDALDS